MYLAALISLVVFIIGSVTLINTALKAWVFPVSESYYYDDPAMNCRNELTLAKGGQEGYVSKFESEEQCVTYYEEFNRKQNSHQRNRDLSFGLSMTIVALPIWILHMSFIRKDRKEEGKGRA